MIITRTPLRITFTGGGSDMPSYFEENGGHCINATIDKYVYVLVKKRPDNKIYLKYSENEVVDVGEIDKIQHDFIRETLIYLGVDYGLEIINWADIPTKGSGLGSSGSFLVGLLNAIHHLEGNDVSKIQLADQASYIEMKLCNKPIGYQDQYAASFGGLNEIIFHPMKRIHHEIDVLPIEKNFNNLSLISDNLLLFYTGKTRDSSTVLTEQNKNLSNNKDSIASMKINVNLSVDLSESIKNKDYTKIGESLKANWEVKKKFSSNIVSEEIVEMYNKGIESGAIGGKIIGAGGGGFMMFYVEKSYQESVINSLSNYDFMRFNIDRYGSRVLLNTEN